ncbi:MerR family transcriptional regulator [Lactobacillus terrae]|uniref:MerR family transcriptional regulator n=1 Tax=Lactobacillus terrae TaxID=2269374 RepID=UPI003CCBCAA7
MYKIGEFSKKVNLSVDTLRYYEKEELIIPGRLSNNLSIYSEKDVRWIEFIKRLKSTGMSINHIKEFSKLRYEGDRTIPQRMELLFDQRLKLENDKKKIDEHINFIDNKIDTYKKMQEDNNSR